MTKPQFPLVRPFQDPEWVNPLVCLCRGSRASLRVNWGECPSCRRKPLRLMKRMTSM